MSITALFHPTILTIFAILTISTTLPYCHTTMFYHFICLLFPPCDHATTLSSVHLYHPNHRTSSDSHHIFITRRFYLEDQFSYLLITIYHFGPCHFTILPHLPINHLAIRSLAISPMTFVTILPFITHNVQLTMYFVPYPKCNL